VELSLEQQDIERIARATLKELGVVGVDLLVAPVAGQPRPWRIDFRGSRGIKIKCGQGTTPQWVREQIFEQYVAQN
jgi:hypothetical protein